MPDKLKFFSVEIFAADSARLEPGITRQTEILLPVDAISHLSALDKGNPKAGYKIHIKKGYPLDAPFPIKSINPGRLTWEQVEILK